MSDRERFLAAVIAELECDTVRLAFADWLDEQGEADRSEFIRVQCRIAALEAAVQRWVHTPHDQPGGSAEDGGPAGAALAEAQSLGSRERELMTPYNVADWMPQVFGLRWNAWRFDGEGYNAVCAEDTMRMLFRRGFVESVHVRCADWLRDGPAVVRAAPVTRVVLTEFRPTCGDGIAGAHWSTLDETPRADRSCVLPWELFRRLDGGKLSDYGGQMQARHYPAEAEAMDALSAAAIRWARGEG